MLAGILAAAIIVLSQSFYYQAKEKAEQANTEQQQDGEQEEVIVAAPSDAVSQTNAIQLSDHATPLQQIGVEQNSDHELPVICEEAAMRYFRILFRAIISPNAP